MLDLKEEELLAIKYYIMFSVYNGYPNDSYVKMAKKYSEKSNNNAKNIKRDYGFRFYNANFYKYGDLIEAIVLNKGYEAELKKLLRRQSMKNYTLSNTKELYFLVLKLIYVFSANKDENRDVYERLIGLKNKLETPSLISIFTSACKSNIFNSTDFVSRISRQFQGGSINTRKLKLSDYKERKIAPVNFNYVYKKSIMDNLDYYLERFQEGDRSVIHNADEYRKIKTFVENKVDTIARHIDNFKGDAVYLITGGRPVDDCIERFILILQKEVIQFIRQEHYGSDVYKSRYKEKFEDVEAAMRRYRFTRSARIYCNTPYSTDGLLFLTEYIKKCRYYGIDYDMKGMDKTAGYEGCDVTILYSYLSDLPIRVKILEEIKAEHPDWIKTFGSPPASTGKINGSYYGVCHVGSYTERKDREEEIGFRYCDCNNMTYNDYIDWICYYASLSAMCKLIVNDSEIMNSIDSNYREAIRNLAYLKNIKKSETSSTIFGKSQNLTINGLALDEIRNYITFNNINKKIIAKGYNFSGERWINDVKARLNRLNCIVNDRNVILSPVVNPFIYDELLTQLHPNSIDGQIRSLEERVNQIIEQDKSIRSMFNNTNGASTIVNPAKK